MKKNIHCVITAFLNVVLIALCFTACGEQELSFGKEIFYGVKAAEEMAFTKEVERPVQIAVGESRVWILTANSRDCVYEREMDAEAMYCLGGSQGEQELVMGISAVDHTLYASVSCGENVQVRKFSGDRQWETIVSIPWEEAPEQKQPALFFVDRAENAYFTNGDEIWKYSPENGQKIVYELKAPAAFLQEKEPGVVEAVAKSNREIVLYTLREEGKAEKKWAIKLSGGNLMAILTGNPDTLVMAVNGRILFVNNATGEMIAYFDSIAAGVSSNLLGGLWLAEEGEMYLVEQDGGLGGIWEKLAVQSGPEGDRTVLVYGTVSFSEAMKERVVSFNKTNPDYYITVKEYDGDNISAGRMQLQAAVTSGNGPDILDLSTYCVDNYISYAEKGYLEDLEPYLLREDYYDDILWPVLDLYRVKGKICMLTPHFTMQGLAVNPKYVKETENWNFNTFEEVAGLVQGGQHIVEGGTARSILAEILPGMQGEFIDWNEKRAYFNTPEFVSLLELCKKCEKESLVKVGVSYDRLEYADQVMIIRLSMHDPGGYLGTHAYYGEHALPYGYPTMDGQVFLVNNAPDACGIYSQSKNKEGAWEFLRTLFSEDYQKQMTGYTVSWAVRESCWYEMWDRYASGININGVNAAPATDEEIERLADMIINGNLTANLMNYTIENLVMEEADAYFKGDHTAQEAAGNIQNRVQLILQE